MQKGLATLPRFGIYLGSAVGSVENMSPDNNGVLTFGGSRESEFADADVRFVGLQDPFEVYKVAFGAMNVTNTNGSKDANLSWEGSLIADTGKSSHLSCIAS